MIVGEYPCCDGDLMIMMPEFTPAYHPEDCPHCATKVWHHLSRVQSTTWTEERFLELYEVNYETHRLEPKNAQEGKRLDDLNMTAKAIAEAMNGGPLPDRHLPWVPEGC